MDFFTVREGSPEYDQAPSLEADGMIHSLLQEMQSNDLNLHDLIETMKVVKQEKHIRHEGKKSPRPTPPDENRTMIELHKETPENKSDKKDQEFENY